jgi:hypothetical protein
LDTLEVSEVSGIDDLLALDMQARAVAGEITGQLEF